MERREERNEEEYEWGVPAGPPPDLDLPFAKKRRREAGEWIYDNRETICITVIVYLLVAIVLLSSRIILQPRREDAAIVMDFSQAEELQRLEEELERAQRLNDMLNGMQAPDYGEVKNAVSNEHAEEMEESLSEETRELFERSEEVMEQIALFPAEWQQRRELTELREATERKLRVSAGHPYIDIAAKNADGGEVSLKSVVENRRNKYVLLDFWASWCGPCMAEIPFLKADYEKYGKKGFEIYAVSFDSQRDRWIDAVRQQGMKWIQVSDLSGFQTPAAEAYAVQSIPSNFLLRCSDGQIVATQLRGEALGEKLGELLGD